MYQCLHLPLSDPLPLSPSRNVHREHGDMNNKFNLVQLNLAAHKPPLPLRAYYPTLTSRPMSADQPAIPILFNICHDSNWKLPIFK